MDHSLVVGGTGMLRDVSLHLAQHNAVSVVARTERDLQQLKTDATRLPGDIHPLRLDYCDVSALEYGLHEAVRLHGPVYNAVCWIHSDATDATAVLAETLTESSPGCRLFHVCGYEAADPSLTADPYETLRNVPDLLYRRVVLGFVVDGGRSRWLKDIEIGAGVIRALEQDLDHSVVGTVTPFDAHP